MYDAHRDLVDALAAMPDALDGLLNGVSEEQARAARGGDEGWSVIEVACHLRDAEEHSVRRVRAMIEADRPILAGYDQEALAIEHDYAHSPLAPACAEIARLRAIHVDLLRALSDAGWEREGMHDERGRVTIENYVIHIVGHDMQHLGQIARALRDA